MGQGCSPVKREKAVAGSFRLRYPERGSFIRASIWYFEVGSAPGFLNVEDIRLLTGRRGVACDARK